MEGVASANMGRGGSGHDLGFKSCSAFQRLPVSTWQVRKGCFEMPRKKEELLGVQARMSGPQNTSVGPCSPLYYATFVLADWDMPAVPCHRHQKDMQL